MEELGKIMQTFVMNRIYFNEFYTHVFVWTNGDLNQQPVSLQIRRLEGTNKTDIRNAVERIERVERLVRCGKKLLLTTSPHLENFPDLNFSLTEREWIVFGILV